MTTKEFCRIETNKRKGPIVRMTSGGFQLDLVMQLLSYGKDSHPAIPQLLYSRDSRSRELTPGTVRGACHAQRMAGPARSPPARRHKPLVTMVMPSTSPWPMRWTLDHDRLPEPCLPGEISAQGTWAEIDSSRVQEQDERAKTLAKLQISRRECSHGLGRDPRLD